MKVGAFVKYSDLCGDLKHLGVANMHNIKLSRGRVLLRSTVG